MSHEDLNSIAFDLPKNQSNVIKVIGVGGGGSNAIKHMFQQGIKGVDFVICNTDSQALENSPVPNKIQLGVSVDSLIIINNNKLREVYGNLGFKAGFSKADEVLATASRGIAEVITHHYTQNIDLRDAKTVLANSGTAIMGSATSSGTNRAQEGILKALDSPLLNDNKIKGAKNVLLLIVSGSDEITIDEIGEINDLIQVEAGGGANIIMGVGEDESLGDAVSVTVIATGFNVEQQNEISNTEAKRIIHTLEDEQRASTVLETNEVIPGKIIMDLGDEEEQDDEGDFAFAKAEQPQPTATTEPEEPLKIIHNLVDDEPEPAMPPVTKEHALIPTTEFIKNLNVVYEEVLDQVEPEQFVIREETPQT